LSSRTLTSCGRPEPEPGESTREGVAELHITKHRNGKEGLVKLAWLPERQQFETLAMSEVDGVVTLSGGGERVHTRALEQVLDLERRDVRLWCTDGGLHDSRTRP
jgi:hypothetical protein